MRWQTTTALAVVLLLVGGFYYVYDVRWAPDRERAETRKGRVFSAEAADVTAVELKRRDDTGRLVPAAEGWGLRVPLVQPRRPGGGAAGPTHAVTGNSVPENGHQGTPPSELAPPS